MKSVLVHGKTWFDKTYGNSYWSARVFVDGEEVARLPFQYGYGNQYMSATGFELQRIGLLPANQTMSLRQQVALQGAILYAVLEQSRKSDVTGWGKPWVNV